MADLHLSSYYNDNYYVIALPLPKGMSGPILDFIFARRDFLNTRMLRYFLSVARVIAGHESRARYNTTCSRPVPWKVSRSHVKSEDTDWNATVFSSEIPHRLLGSVGRHEMELVGPHLGNSALPVVHSDGNEIAVAVRNDPTREDDVRFPSGDVAGIDLVAVLLAAGHQRLHRNADRGERRLR